jgi:hypothetical protein
MHGIKSPEGRWSVLLCNCSVDTAHLHYGNVVLHILRADLRAIGVAMQTIADEVAGVEADIQVDVKKGLVQ